MSLLSNFQKDRRQNIALILIGGAFASFTDWQLLWFRLMATQPRNPDVATGLIYPMNNHGWIYYLSAMQSNRLDLLACIFVGLFITGAATYGRIPVKLAWERYPPPAKGSVVYFLAAFALLIAVIWTASYPLASLLAGKGVILASWL